MLIRKILHPCCRQLIAVIFFAFVSLAAWQAALADQVVGTGKGAVTREISISYCEFHTTHRFAVETVREAYKRIGIVAKFVSRPCRRSLIEANSGRFGGEVARISGTSDRYTNLIPIDAPTITIEGVVIAKDVKRGISEWSDLKGLYTGFIRGELYAEKGTAAVKAQAVDSYSQLLKMLARDRFDTGVVIRRDFDLVNRSPEFWNENIHVIGKPVFSAPLHHLVHKSNQDLLPKLNAVFLEMWNNGDAEAIHSRTFKFLTSQ